MSRFLRNNEKEKGITLIALITTIIVLLILAGITIGAITGSNGIIGQAQSAKEETEIANEKEIIDISTVEAMGKNNRGNLEEEEFQTAVSNHTNGKATVSDIGEEFEVFFEESGRYYSVDKDGNILDYVVGAIDQYPGDITKKEDGTVLDGSIDKPYEINCIEDLVALSNMVNRAGKVYQNGNLIDGKDSRTLSSEVNIILTRDLNFKSNASYIDSSRTDFGDINGDGETETLITELTTKRGFIPIGFSVDGKTARSFSGNFDGNNKKIENIYINYEDDEVIDNYGFGRSIGLFGRGDVNSTTISNLEVSGDIKGLGYAGGIIGYNLKKIESCTNRANISGNNFVGGISGASSIATSIVTDCKNYGIISGNKVAFSAGGVGGIAGNIQEIQNCENYGDIKISEENTSGTLAGGYGGIVGSGNYLYNCKNEGNIEIEQNGVSKNCGGIVGWYKSTGIIKNCENFGNIEAQGNLGGIAGYINGGDWSSIVKVEIENCSNRAEKIESTATNTAKAGIIGNIGTLYAEVSINLRNCYNTTNMDFGVIGYIGNTSGKQTIEIQNVYDNNENHFNGKNSNTIYVGEVIKKTNEEMQKQEFVDLLNSYVSEDTSIPLSRWELGEDKFPTLINK